MYYKIDSKSTIQLAEYDIPTVSGMKDLFSYAKHGNFLDYVNNIVSLHHKWFGQRNCKLCAPFCPEGYPFDFVILSLYDNSPAAPKVVPIKINMDKSVERIWMNTLKEPQIIYNGKYESTRIVSYSIVPELYPDINLGKSGVIAEADPLLSVETIMIALNAYEYLVSNVALAGFVTKDGGTCKSIVPSSKNMSAFR